MTPAAQFSQSSYSVRSMEATGKKDSSDNVCSMHAPNRARSSTSPQAFHDQVENLVHNTQEKNKIKSDYWLIGGAVAGIQTLRTDKVRGQQLLQIFPAATTDDLKTVASDEALVEAMIDKADSLDCKRCFDQIYKYISNVTLLEKIIELRFGVPVGTHNISWWDRSDATDLLGRNQEQQWTVNGLIHVYGVYRRLPQSDLDLVKGLLTTDTNAARGVSGNSRPRIGMYYVNYKDDTTKGAFDPGNPINHKGKFAKDATYTRTNLVSIDMTTAHELGHIVDFNAPGGRYSEKFDASGNALPDSFVAISGWRRHSRQNGIATLYTDIKTCINDPYALSGGGNALSGAEQSVVDLAGQRILERRAFKERPRRNQIRAALTASSMTTANHEVQRIEHSAIIEHLIRANNNESAYDKEPFNNLPNRQIHEDRMTKDWFSYPNNARTGQKISTYQFQNPREEFAETYASYHVSNPKGAATPRKLKTWFESAGLDRSRGR